MNYQLYHGDCLEVMKQIPEKSVDLILTDPPYGINLTPQRSGGKFKDTKVINDDNMDWLPSAISEYKRILKDDSAGYVFCNWQNYDIFKREIEKHFLVKNCLVWDKDWFGLGNNWRPVHEFIILFVNGKFKTKSNNKSNILKFRRMSAQKMIHSCEKPVAMLESLIEESCDVGAVVLDSFFGSGGTGIACINTNRNFIGIELDEKYFQIARDRIDKHYEETYDDLKNKK